MDRVNGAQFSELEQIVTAHQRAVAECFNLSYTITGDGQKTRFIGGGDKGLIETTLEDGRETVTCSSAALYFRLFRENEFDPYFVGDLLRRDLVKTNVYVDLASRNLKILSPFHYFEFPISEFLGRNEVEVSEIKQQVGVKGEREVVITWQWTDPKSGIWVGRFTLLPDHDWIAKKIERTRDFKIGVMTISHEFDDATEFPVYKSRRMVKRFVGKEEELMEALKLHVDSVEPAPTSRFRLSYYGLSDRIGERTSRKVLLGISILLSIILITIWLRVPSTKRKAM